MPFATIWYKAGLLLLAFSLAVRLPAQDPIVIYDLQASQVLLNPYIEVYHTPDSLSPEALLGRLASGALTPSSYKSSPGFTEDYYWLRFVLLAVEEGQYVIELSNPHIDHVLLYSVSGADIQLIGRGGDKKPFSYRTEDNRGYLFRVKLKPGQPRELLLMVDKRNASVSFPLRLWGEGSYAVHEGKMSLLYGIYFGVLLFISGFSLLIGLTLRERHFLSYSVYVGIVALYMFTQLGFSFQYIYPWSPVLNNYARVVVSFVLLITSVDFFSRLLDVGFYLPRLQRVYRVGLAVLVCTLVFWVVNRIFNPYYAQYTIFTLNVLYLMVIAFFGSIFYASFRTWKQQKANVMLVMTAFFFLMLGSCVYILVEYGLIPESFLPVNPILLGSIIEVLILTVSMVYRVKTLSDRRDELSEKLLRQQKALMRAYIRGGDMERQRISAELHDHIGSNLSLLKRKISQEGFDVNEVNTSIDALCGEVRDLSHQLVPHQLHLLGLSEMVSTYCQRFERDTGIRVVLDSFDFPDLPEHLNTPLFRVVQEAMQNILKHSRASLIEIQLLGHKDEVVITIDDDGVGFDPGHTTHGNGLVNMKTRMASVNGSIDISSYQGKGTNILVTLPI